MLTIQDDDIYLVNTIMITPHQKIILPKNVFLSKEALNQFKSISDKNRIAPLREHNTKSIFAGSSVATPQQKIILPKSVFLSREAENQFKSISDKNSIAPLREHNTIKDADELQQHKKVKKKTISLFNYDVVSLGMGKHQAGGMGH